MNLPNKLTTARFFMALAFVGLMAFDTLPTWIAAYILFTAATITDHFDGKIARRDNIVTNFGKLLDPVADKVLMAGAFVCMMSIPMLRIPAWTIVVIIAREFLITGVRSLAASGGNVIGANSWGKTKTVLQMVYVFTFLFLAIVAQIMEQFIHVAWMPRALDHYLRVAGVASMASIILVALVTVYSGVQFIRVNWGALNLSEEM